jgi:hypothetical protein
LQVSVFHPVNLSLFEFEHTDFVFRTMPAPTAGVRFLFSCLIIYYLQ